MATRILDAGQLSEQELIDQFVKWAEPFGYQLVSRDAIIPELRNRIDLILEKSSHRIYIDIKVSGRHGSPSYRVDVDTGGSVLLAYDNKTRHWIAEFGGVPILLQVEENPAEFFDLLSR